jgi:DNA-binding transcriptional LysR family regulator
MLDALTTFVAVANAGNFSAVAKAQGIAVSSITRRIELLEAELKARLFSRSSRRLTLTDAGEHLLPRARSILAELSEAKAGLTALSADTRGVLTVTAPTMFGRRHVAPAVVSFLDQHPLLEIELHLGDEIIDLAERRVDVAIRMATLRDSDLVTTRLAAVRRIVCASPQYLKKAGTPATPIDLLQHNCLTVASTPTPAGWWAFAGVNREMALQVRGNLRSDDTGTLLQAAVAGLGIVHLADWLVSDMILAGSLVPLFLNAAPSNKLSSSVQAVRMPGRSHAAKAQLFINHLRKSFGSPPYWGLQRFPFILDHSVIQNEREAP